MPLINWIKTHKSTSILIAILAFFGWNILHSALGLGSLSNLSIPTLNSATQYGTDSGSRLDSGITSAGIAAGAPADTYPKPYEQVSVSSSRMVISNSSLSMVVKDVKQTGDKILVLTQNLGGFMVNTYYNDPTGTAFGTISVRIPTDKVNDAFDQFRALAVKVTNENISGTDVTQQYQDLDAQLATLNSTKTKFQEILDKATQVQDILSAYQQIIYTQQQIDAIKGQKMALSDNARFTMITIDLSTDELALPYAPDHEFRPNLIFKQAVRSMLSTLQWLAGAIIWVVVFAVIWIPLVIIYTAFKRWKQNMKKSPLS